MKKTWLKKFGDRVDNIVASLGCFGYLIAAALTMGLVFLLFSFFGYIFSISPMLGFILMFGAFGCPFYFSTRKRWIFWLYLSIVVAVFFYLLSTQQFA